MFSLSQPVLEFQISPRDWSAVSSQSSHHPHEVLLDRFSSHVHRVGLKPNPFHFHISDSACKKNLRNIDLLALLKVLPSGYNGYGTPKFLKINLKAHLYFGL